MFGPRRVAEVAGLTESDVSSSVRGLIGRERAYVGPLSVGEIRVYFFFDRHDKLIKYYIDTKIYSF
jgi:hypothetical protein